LVLTNRWKKNASQLIRAATKGSPPNGQQAIHSALEHISGAKVVEPSEERLKSFQRQAQPDSMIKVRIVLYFYDSSRAENAVDAFKNENILTTVSHPSAYCGRAYNVRLDIDEHRLREYISYATNESHADSFAFRRLRSRITGLPTTTVEWAALDEAASAIVNVQLPDDSHGKKLGIVWRVAYRHTRLPDELPTDRPAYDSTQPASKTAPPTQRNYASAVRSGLTRQQPNTTDATVTSSSALPTTNSPQPAQASASSAQTDTTIVATLLRHIEQMQAAAERREKTQNEVNTKLLNRISEVMKASIEQFCSQMQLFQSVLTSHTNVLTNLAAAVNAKPPNNSDGTSPPANTQPPTPAHQSQSASSPSSRRRQQTSTVQRPSRPMLNVVTSPMASDHSSDPTGTDIEANVEVAATMSQLIFSQSSTASSVASSITETLVDTVSLHSLTPSDDASANPEPEEPAVTTTDTNNVIRHSNNATDTSPSTAPPPNKPATQKGLRSRTRSIKNLSRAEKQDNYSATRPPNSSRSTAVKSKTKPDCNKQ
jgi:hypothetical protein